MRSAISFTVISSQPHSILTPIHDLVVLLVETLLNFREKGLDPVSKLLWRRRVCCTHMAGRSIRVLKVSTRLTLPWCCGQVSDARDSIETITSRLTRLHHPHHVTHIAKIHRFFILRRLINLLPFTLKNRASLFRL